MVFLMMMHLKKSMPMQLSKLWMTHLDRLTSYISLTRMLVGLIVMKMGMELMKKIVIFMKKLKKLLMILMNGNMKKKRKNCPWNGLENENWTLLWIACKNVNKKHSRNISMSLRQDTLMRFKIWPWMMPFHCCFQKMKTLKI